jgi:hypothetical protein
MAVEQVQVAIPGPSLTQENTPGFLRTGSYGELIVQQLFGKYAELTRRGYVYAAHSAAAATIPVNTTLTNSPTLWNKASSGKLVYPLQLMLSPAAIGTPVIQGFTISWLKNTGDGVGTGAPIVTFTNVAPSPCLIGRGACSAFFAPATDTFTTQPAALMDIGLGYWLSGTAATGAPSFWMYDFDGTVVMPPGTSISLGSATAASSITYWTTIIFAELPLPALWT